MKLYWLELLNETEIISQNEFDSIYADATELMKIIRSIILKSKSNIKKLENLEKK